MSSKGKRAGLNRCLCSVFVIATCMGSRVNSGLDHPQKCDGDFVFHPSCIPCNSIFNLVLRQGPKGNLTAATDAASRWIEGSCAQGLRLDLGGFQQPSGTQGFYFKPGFLLVSHLISLFFHWFSRCRILEQCLCCLYPFYVEIHHIRLWIATELLCKTLPVLLWSTSDDFDWYEALTGIKSLYNSQHNSTASAINK